MYKILKQGSIFLVIITLVIFITGAVGYCNGSSMKPSYNESERSGEKIAADAVFLRPAGIIATALGAAVFIVSSPFSLLGENIEEAFEKLVKKPARYTFKRPLGDY